MDSSESVESTQKASISKRLSFGLGCRYDADLAPEPLADDLDTARPWLGQSAATELTLAVVAPKSGPYQALGDQVRQGAVLAAGSLSIALVEVDETCDEGSGKAIAEAIAAAGAKAAIGFLCSESLKDALPSLKQSEIPALTLSVRWKGLMEDALKQAAPVFRLAPNAIRRPQSSPTSSCVTGRALPSHFWKTARSAGAN